MHHASMSLHDAQLEENLILPIRRAVATWDALEEPQKSPRLMELREAVRAALEKFDSQPRVEESYSGEKSLAGKSKYIADPTDDDE